MNSGIAYNVAFVPAHHIAVVTATIPVQGRASMDLSMAVWTPGSYLLREYARHITTLVAHDAHDARRTLAVVKVAKNRWEVACDGVATLQVVYHLYCREMSVRTNWVDSAFAVLNGACTFLTVPDYKDAPHDVQVQLPESWRAVQTGLAAHPGGQAHHFRASNYDTLVDCPILAGNPTLHQFDVDGRSHTLASVEGGGVWDNARAALDVEKIIQCQAKFWGALPYDRYVFLNLLVGGRGGLEHKNSSLLAASRWAQGSRTDYLDWLGLVSHEFFHVWNIKRLRPEALGPFDYERENYTRNLWVAEGFTAYYDDLLLHRAGLASQKEYLQMLSKSIQNLQNTPGRAVQPLGESSFDAWIKLYRRDENSDNVAISYYTKGCVVGFLLDAKIRAVTGNARSLDSLMRRAYETFSAARGFTDGQWRSLAAEIAGVDLAAFFVHAVDGTQELDYTEALAWYGLTFSDGDDKAGKSGEPGPKTGWLGVTTKSDAGRLVVSEVRCDGPAAAAGINVEDEIIGIDAWRVTAATWRDRLKHFGAGAVTSLLVARREMLLRLQVSLAEEPSRTWALRPVKEPTAAQQANLDAWLTRM